jgi:PAS domain S-box-containing protein/putative nucleotidyltransferase with HDIG domain
MADNPSIQPGASEIARLQAALEALEASQREIGQAKQEWLAAVDAVPDPLFVHDGEYRILRANRAYAARAGMDFHELIGKPYWQVFPKHDGPLPGCIYALHRQQVHEDELHLPSGDVFLVRHCPILDDDGNYLYSLHIMQDITARRQADAQLRLFRDLLDHSNDAIEVIDPATLRFLDVNETECRDLGYSREELLSLCVTDIDPGFGPAEMAMIDKQIKETGMAVFERMHRRKDGSTFPVEISLKFVEIGRPYALNIARDISARREAEATLRESESKFRTIFDGSYDGILLADAETRRFHLGNRRIHEMLGYTANELIGMSVDDIHPADALPHVIEEFSRQLRGELGVAAELPVRRKDGSVFYADVNSAPMTLDGKHYLLGVFRDTTERKRTAEALRHSEASLAEAQHIAHLGSWGLDLVSRKLAWSDEIYRMFELDPTQFGASYEAFLAAVHPDDRELVHRAYRRHLRHRAPYDLEHRILLPDGCIRYVHEKCETVYDNARPLRSLGTVQDVTDRKLAEIALEKSNRALKALSACNAALVHADKEEQLLQDMCRVIVEAGGYAYAWIGYAGHDAGKRILPMAQAGFEPGYLEKLPLTWSDTDAGHGMAGTVIREGAVVVSKDVVNDPALSAWHDVVVQLGLGSGATFPLMRGNETFGALSIYARERGAFDREELTLLAELSEDLTFGILTLRARVAHEQLQQEHLKSAERLKESLTDTIRAIALTVEKRDPYTAGHQSRVADLSAAIAGELGLEAERIEGLRLGAMIHDIGKIYVPAEILNRPGRLTAPEFEIIKSHTEVGYDIIKDVKFPWPVADMILQHHERMDGSGYPKGLKGEDIILEARILGVADVVEAITAHRPYRPAIGIAAGLAEIEAKRGQLYDVEVVDACLRLFREKGYTLQDKETS